MFNPNHTPENREKIIAREQTGSVPDMPLPEQIAMLDKQIKTAVSFIVFYQSKHMTKRMSKAAIAKAIHDHELTAAHLTEQREALKSKQLREVVR